MTSCGNVIVPESGVVTTSFAQVKPPEGGASLAGGAGGRAGPRPGGAGAARPAGCEGAGAPPREYRGPGRPPAWGRRAPLAVMGPGQRPGGCRGRGGGASREQQRGGVVPRGRGGSAAPGCRCAGCRAQSGGKALMCNVLELCGGGAWQLRAEVARSGRWRWGEAGEEVQAPGELRIGAGALASGGLAVGDAGHRVAGLL